MDSRLKDFFQLLWNERTTLKTLSDALAARRPILESNESDRVLAFETIKFLKREWLEKTASCN